MSLVIKMNDDNRHILLEKYILTRANYWTGLRCAINKPIGRNWMTYYCIKRITKNTGPLDCIMYLINEFINWIPAGCWKNTNIFPDSCTVCNCGSWGGDLIKVPIAYCSYQCLETDRRNDLFIEQNNITNLMTIFKQLPHYVNQELEFILDEITGNPLIDGFPLEWMEDETDYDYSDFD